MQRGLCGQRQACLCCARQAVIFPIRQQNHLQVVSPAHYRWPEPFAMRCNRLSHDSCTLKQRHHFSFMERSGVWPLTPIFELFSKPSAGQLYGTAMAQARQRDFYANLGVADTPAGRLAMISLHILLILQRLSRSDAASPMQKHAAPKTLDDNECMGRALMETFVTDLDRSIRELGIGDMGVPKRVKSAMALFYDHAGKYRAARLADDHAALDRVLDAMIPGVAVATPAMHAVRTYVLDVEQHLSNLTSDEICRGAVTFPKIVHHTAGVATSQA